MVTKEQIHNLIDNSIWKIDPSRKVFNILIEEIFDDNVTIVNTYPLPTTSYRFTKIKSGTRIIITDEINNKMINTIYGE